MNFSVNKSHLKGAVQIPGSKSHTIRAVAVAALASGESVIERPLESADARSARHAYAMLGASIEETADCWRVQGTGGLFAAPENVIDVGNSGTTMRMALGSAALLRAGKAVLTGDAQVRRRPCGPLAASLNTLGASVEATRGNGMPPFVVSGILRGGAATIEAITSQYVSSLLLNAPLAEKDTRLLVPLLNEKPYVVMTLDWLQKQGVRVSHNEDLSEFHIPGGQRYTPVRRAIPADFSSATFFLAAGALAGNNILCLGLDMEDTQGDKAVLEYLVAMGADISHEPEGIRVRGNSLRGTELDLNATPDALPMMAALACFAEGETRLVNVPQARLKETDRISVMHEELEKLGARITELDDGMVIEGSTLHGGDVEGHDDHRVVMALAIAATAIKEEVRIHGAEAVDVTYPGFVEDMKILGGKVAVK
jgi:3-phosphoshikimate 1-carboxyvinyltransferase